MLSLDDLYNLFRKFPLISTDSRSIAPGSLFFALKGNQFDGNLFAMESINLGAAFAITDNPDLQSHERILLVENVLEALQKLALNHRKHIKARIIAITGSNGKTTTKELIGKVLGSSYNTIITQGNLNNHIGVPLTLLSIKDNTDIAVIEMGANHQGEIAALCQIASPNYGLITNIGKAHLEGFGGYKGVIKAKSELYDFLKAHQGIVFYNMDDDLLSNLSAGLNRVSYGLNTNANCSCTLIESEPFLCLKWFNTKQSGIVNTSLYGDYNIENVIASICIGAYFEIDPNRIQDAIASYVPENNRSQVIKTKRNQIISDAYNANPSSMKAAISHFSRMNAENKLLILGDMMELGEFSFVEHENIILLTRELGFNQVILVGEMFCQVAKDGSENCFNSTADAASWLNRQQIQNMTILVKGSRKMQLENLRKYL